MTQGVVETATHTRVCVVVPAYNPGPFLRETLDSILAQTFLSWEAVVVDDGSTEDLGWVDTLDPRIRRLRKGNEGLSRARNSGIAASTAGLVAFCDADDLWHPAKLRRQVAHFDADPLLDLSHTAFNRIDGEGAFVGAGFTQHYRDYDALRHGCGICVSTVIVRRSSLERVGGFDPTLRAVEDWDMWLRIARGGRLRRDDMVLANYRVHPASMSRDFRLILKYWKIVLRRHNSSSERTDVRNMKHNLGGQAFDEARAALRSRKVRPFLRGMGYALLWAPHYTMGSTFSKLTSSS